MKLFFVFTFLTALVSCQTNFELGDRLHLKSSSSSSTLDLTVISEPITSGSTATVYKTKDHKGNEYAFKYFQCKKSDSDSYHSLSSTPKCSKLTVENEVKVLEVLDKLILSGTYMHKTEFSSLESAFIVTPFINGKPIRDFAYDTKNTIPIQDFHAAAENALYDIHAKHVLHNDLNINNILFSIKGEEVKASIIDFGMAHYYGQERIPIDKLRMENAKLRVSFLDKWIRTGVFRKKTRVSDTVRDSPIKVNRILFKRAQALIAQRKIMLLE